MQYTIKEVAEKVELTPHTLRYYENEGLLPYILRDTNGNRVFSDTNVEWLRFVKCLRDTSMPISEMRHFVNLSMQGDDTVPERMEILYQHRENLEKKLKEMSIYLNNINNKIEHYESCNIDVSKGKYKD
ncbi:MAG: MerR family transcriptional regulator [Firmicutes bacterium HGW-Firmicutes-7]|nr:MAG: MerR family transcriptional regulator [Firmicutes bacterium HGW-Firmicutes-7]